MTPYSHHSAYLHVSTNAVSENWLKLDRATAPQCRTGAVVKANAYGLGMNEISKSLYQAGCRHFYTARLSEAISLSDAFAKSDITDAEIIVFDGMMSGQEDAFITHKLIAVINDRKQLDHMRHVAKQTSRALDAIIHIDTGMARLGLAPLTWQEIRKDDSWSKGLDIKMVMSHLASADDETASQNEQQYQLFKQLTDGLDIPRSLANSAGTMLSDKYHFDATRPGLSLYGLSPNEQDFGLATAFRLTTDILQKRTIPKGASVGYGASYIAPETRQLATLGIGYADGFYRHFQPHIMPRIMGIACPLVGRISMDSCVVDISALSDTQRQNAKEAVIFDDTITPHQLAKKTGTISYELMTTLGERILRQYDSDEMLPRHK